MRFLLILGIVIVVGDAAAGYFVVHYDYTLVSSVTAQVIWVLVLILGMSLIAVYLQVKGAIGSAAVDRATFILAVAAIIFAIWQFRDARSQENSSRAQEKRMEQLSTEMSTRFAGMFPKNMKDINDILQEPDASVDIMADFVGYGHYSAPEEFDKYIRRLQDLKSQTNVHIRVLVYTEQKARRVHDSQFTEASFQKALKSHDRRLTAFCDRYNRGKIPQSKAEFDALLFRKQRDYVKDLQERGIEIRATEQELPFFLWTEDDQESVFSFLNEDLPEAREATFRTRDSSLIVDTFKVRFCKLWNEAHDAELTNDGWSSASAASQSGDTCNVH